MNNNNSTSFLSAAKNDMASFFMAQTSGRKSSAFDKVSSFENEFMNNFSLRKDYDPGEKAGAENDSVLGFDHDRERDFKKTEEPGKKENENAFGFVDSLENQNKQAESAGTQRHEGASETSKTREAHEDKTTDAKNTKDAGDAEKNKNSTDAEKTAGKAAENKKNSGLGEKENDKAAAEIKDKTAEAKAKSKASDAVGKNQEEDAAIRSAAAKNATTTRADAAAKQQAQNPKEAVSAKDLAARLEKETGTKISNLKIEAEASKEQVGEKTNSAKANDSGREALNILESRSRLLRKNMSNGDDAGDVADKKDGRSTDKRKSESAAKNTQASADAQNTARIMKNASETAAAKTKDTSGLMETMRKAVGKISDGAGEGVQKGASTETQSARADAKADQTAFADAAQKAYSGMKGAGVSMTQNMSQTARTQDAAELAKELVAKMQSNLPGNDKNAPGTKLSMEFDSRAYGHINMSMKQSESGLSVSLEVGSDSAKDNLMNQRDELNRRLNEMGYKNVDLNVTTEQENQNKQNSQDGWGKKGGNEDFDNVKLAGDDKFDMAQILNFK